MGRKKKLGIIENVEITEIAAEGNAIARIDNKVLFVPQAIPGDIVDIQLTRKRTSYMEGYIVNIKKPSSLRIAPFCNHFGVCGGCSWQHLPYDEQLKWKQKQVIDNLNRIGKICVGKINPILPSEDTRFYRNKLEYTFSDNRWLEKEKMETAEFIKEPGVGFHIPGMFDKVLDIDYCHHQPDPSNQIRLTVKEYILKNKLDFFNLRAKEGFIRNLIIRNTSTGEWMVIVSFGRNEKETINDLLNYISEKFPQITSLLYVINDKLNDTINDLEIKIFKGRDFMIEKMEDLSFKIGPKSFFQTNTKQAYKLYSITRNMAGLTGNEIVYDLYTGTGTIANFVAKKAKLVIGIESIEEAIRAAENNSLLNDINNTKFFCGDIKDILTESFIDKYGKPDVLITDPPRAGMHNTVIQSILYSNPAKIIYVSCNSATQARDLNLLSTKYEIAEIQTVDMFPHTYHVENIALLIKKIP